MSERKAAGGTDSESFGVEKFSGGNERDVWPPCTTLSSEFLLHGVSRTCFPTTPTLRIQAQ